MPFLVVVGHGPGNAHAIAKRLGAEGYTVAPVGRDPDRLRVGADRLVQDGVTAHPYVGDAGNLEKMIGSFPLVQTDNSGYRMFPLAPYPAFGERP